MPKFTINYRRTVVSYDTFTEVEIEARDREAALAYAAATAREMDDCCPDDIETNTDPDYRDWRVDEVTEA